MGYNDHGSSNMAGEMAMRAEMERQRQAALKQKYERERAALINSKSEADWAKYVREGGTSPWGVKDPAFDKDGYATLGYDSTGKAIDQMQTSEQSIQDQQSQMSQAQSQDGGGYPAMQNSYGLGGGQSAAPSGTPTAMTSTSNSNPWGSSTPSDSGSRGFSPYSLKGEANYR